MKCNPTTNFLRATAPAERAEQWRIPVPFRCREGVVPLLRYGCDDAAPAPAASSTAARRGERIAVRPGRSDIVAAVWLNCAPHCPQIKFSIGCPTYFLNRRDEQEKGSEDRGQRSEVRTRSSGERGFLGQSVVAALAATSASTPPPTSRASGLSPHR